MIIEAAVAGVVVIAIIIIVITFLMKVACFSKKSRDVKKVFFNIEDGTGNENVSETIMIGTNI